MTEHLKISRSIKSEADYILEQRGVRTILERYGTVKFAGSYHFNLMMKRDLDISLINETISSEGFFLLGNELSHLLKPHSMFYRNTGIKHIQNRPSMALYWGIQFEDWNLDIWAVPISEYIASEIYMEKIAASLTAENRDVILKLKYELMNNGSYGKTFGSKELYDAVLNCNVKTAEEFNKYLTKDNNK
ncbi:MAG: hypothetical protein ACM3Q2_15850 [Syntrophothermus sp.]